MSTSLDLRGEICPYTELRAKRALETLFERAAEHGIIDEVPELDIIGLR